MTKKDEETMGYCCICIIVMIVIGLFITYWYIALPAILIILTGCIISALLSEKKEKYKTTYKTPKVNTYIPPKPEYPPNCENCGIPIKTADDLMLIDKQVCCKYCNAPRIRTYNNKKSNSTYRHYEFGERLHPDEWYETELPNYEENLTHYNEINEEKRSRHISSQVKREVWQRDFGRCVECGSKERLEYDHIIPFSKGGSNTARNIQLLCENCNRKKHNKI